jgi:hypothetical protein
MKLLALTAPLALAAAALAQPGTGGTITHNNATFTQGDAPTTTTSSGPNSSFTVGGAGNPEHMFQNWWWLRVNNDTREHALANATSATWAGSLGQVNYTMAGFSVVQTSQVIGFGFGGALIDSLTIVNTGSTPMTLNAFHYLDLDLNDTSGGDSAVLNGPNQIRVSDGAWIANYEGSGTYEVGPFPTVRELLTNTSINNFSNAGLPFAAADWTGGWQWTLTLQPSEAATITASVTIIPAPASTALLAMGGIFAARRRR